MLSEYFKPDVFPHESIYTKLLFNKYSIVEYSMPSVNVFKISSHSVHLSHVSELFPAAFKTPFTEYFEPYFK